ncbi:ABC transporter permease DevC [uncultured Paraglaciecola sp.]|uniref:ABC transporter permease DevC n=1 Tax=uncultured Paraglaciecola sp. TaxID=1765024 RepID=UPI0026108CAD|nr:ABC transporter permease DevC [uncultured Paraglaciecola sp.]
MQTKVAWLQLKYRPVRLIVALCGIGFAVLLILMQLGFRSALFESAVRYHERLNYDIALFSPDSVFIVRPQAFSKRRLYQALSLEEVEQVMPINIFPAVWKNPWNNGSRSIHTMGFDPGDPIFEGVEFDKLRLKMKARDAMIFDSASRPEFGPVKDTVTDDEVLVTEINNRQIDVVGLYHMGTSFGLDGSVFMSTDNWFRLFPDRSREDIQMGLIKLKDGKDANIVRDKLKNYLPNDVLVMTKSDFVERETAYWNSATPIGYVFTFGSIMGFVVGAIIVYQILFAGVSEYISEYATLRAMGYSSAFVSGIVVQQAMLLGALGFIPGVAVVIWLYSVAAGATNLPLYLTQDRAILVFILTMLMCAISALLSVRRVVSIDPAEVF